MEIYNTNNLSVTGLSQIFPLHYSKEDVNRLKECLYDVNDDYYSLKESLSPENIDLLRKETDDGKKELEELQTMYDDTAYAIEALLQRIEEIKQSPLRRDLEIQQDKIKFLKAALALQVEKYRGNKAEYRRNRKEKVVKGAKTLLEKSILQENIDYNNRVVILHGLQSCVTEIDLRTLFDHYGTIYTVIISNDIAKIEFDTAVAAAKSLNCQSTLFRDIFVDDGYYDDYDYEYDENQDYFSDDSPESTIEPVSKSKRFANTSTMLSLSD
ncbi:hypothetical protein TVAG_133040 [Trichomonas vaginalis G3]|uniref:RRM domain-containing protein n=1 Tax=Trichomonas vaginalis (strain ATCC PRA-98 / G3) TaxID=412133 RepID=A2EDI2_TRIV3|nr:RNA-binding domain, RBD family-containing protein [Trichomonas vaginalis G3]EAY09247.1 hypothetical protein TVAG_133040 [Trichomonas vaginalis G3]KAI5484029.1 RNA-binding domain, RBD family-containing protein [Trichomonas vaginalis G3]|eukprot:XP_001321470.1 hypothetical protein [Trichomonas vaginalis G3]